MNRYSHTLMALLALFCLSGVLVADDFMGEYKGTFLPDSRVRMAAEAKVVAEGDGYYRLVIYTTEDTKEKQGAYIEMYGKHYGPEVVINGRAGGYNWHGNIKNNHLSARSDYGIHFELDKIESKSPRAGLKPPPGAIILLPLEMKKKADMSQWTNMNWKALDKGVMQCEPGKGANRTKREFGDIKQFHIEFKLPLEPHGRGQGRANSGVYLLDYYEVQVLDSFGLTHTSGDCGGLYGVARAMVNACLPPETWQTYDITFRAARLGTDGKARENPRITVIHNDITIHENQEIPKNRHRTKGPFQLQDHGHKIQFRNIWVVEEK